jgi:hypothetical protein
VEEPKDSSTSSNWTWARLLKRVFAIDMECCSVCQQGKLRIVAAIMEASVVKQILRRLIPVLRHASRSLTPWAARAPARGLKRVFVWPIRDAGSNAAEGI